jgi:hypothetical protein
MLPPFYVYRKESMAVGKLAQSRVPPSARLAYETSAAAFDNATLRKTCT